MPALSPQSTPPLELTILMPCLNEAETIAVCVRKAGAFIERAGIHGEVLIADNELFAAEIALVRVRAERNTQLVQVYRAMGGGWVDAVDPSRATGAASDTSAETEGLRR